MQPMQIIVHAVLLLPDIVPCLAALQGYLLALLALDADLVTRATTLCAAAVTSSGSLISMAHNHHALSPPAGFYISPSFLDKLSIHIAKNFMNLPKIKVPLILGIWGGKGQVRHG
jgi:hypothetical protein